MKNLRVRKGEIRMRKLSLMLASIMTVTMALVPTVQASDITVKVNGEEIHPEMAPVIVEERTLVPLRAVSEALGCDVSWDADTKGITLL